MAISTACCKISGCTGSFNRTESLYTEEKSRRCSVGYTIADRSSRYQVFGVCFGFDFDISDSSFRCCWHESVNTQHIAVYRAIRKSAAALLSAASQLIFAHGVALPSCISGSRFLCEHKSASRNAGVNCKNSIHQHGQKEQEKVKSCKNRGKYAIIKMISSFS